MRYRFIVSLFFLFQVIPHLYSQRTITTSSGESFIIYPDHIWEYAITPLKSFYPTCDKNDVVIEKTGFTIAFNANLHEARWVAYIETREKVKNVIAERLNKFRPEKSYSTADDKDYSKSGYDRGHLAPAGDMTWSKEAMYDCFSYLNISPQSPNLNRGVWKQLEDKVREWASLEDSIYIITGGVLKDNLPTIGKDKVAVPQLYYKVILEYSNEGRKGIAFLIPNTDAHQEIANYAVTIDSIENLTGINFFPLMPANIANELEGNIDLQKWSIASTTNSNQRLATSVQCSGITKSGNRCKRMTYDVSGYCWQHISHNGQINSNKVNSINSKSQSIATDSSAVSTRCKAITKAGTQCKRNAQPGSDYCWQHQGQSTSSGSSGTSTGTSTGTTSTGKTIYTGPRGGQYYINSSGKKTYIKKK
jgi:endonuclease G